MLLHQQTASRIHWMQPILQQSLRPSHSTSGRPATFNRTRHYCIAAFPLTLLHPTGPQLTVLVYNVVSLHNIASRIMMCPDQEIVCATCLSPVSMIRTRL
jgi:hypothetical protein